MTKLRCLQLVVLLLVASVSFALALDRESLQPPNTIISEQFFGMHIHHATDYTPWPTVSFGVWRLWDSFLAWPNLEPSKGKWDFTVLDKAVDLAEKHNVEILLPLALTPQWASARPNDKGYGPLGSASEPKDIADWQIYVRTVATRYKGRIHEYEIWNEPNSMGFYTGSIPELVELARVAYTTLKQVDPTIIVGSPPVAGDGFAWLDQYLKAGGGKYADAIDYHFYVNPDPPEEMVPMIEHVRQIMRDNGAGSKPLWDTETGWAIQNKEGTVKPTEARGFNSVVLPEDLAAAYLARAYVLSWASGVSRLYWYAWDNGEMGLVEPDRKTLKGSAIAYGQVENWLVGATMTSCGSTLEGIWSCVITRPGGYYAHIVWDPDRTISMTVPTTWKVREIRDLSGGTRPLNNANSIQLGTSPLLLVSSGEK